MCVFLSGKSYGISQISCYLKKVGQRQRIHKLSFVTATAVGALTISSLAPELADTVQSASGLFTAGAGVIPIANSLSFTSGATVLQLLLAPQAGNVDTPVVADLGTFQVNIAGTGNVAIQTLPVTSTFQLTINQTVPSDDSSNLDSTLGGAISFNSGFVGIPD